MVRRLKTCRFLVIVLCLVFFAVCPDRAGAFGFAEADVMLFHIKEYATWEDVVSYSEIASDLKLSSQIVDHHFINDRNAFFDKEGRRKFNVLVLPGAFQNFCGVHAFKGTLRGPQESNRPYPKTRFLPIRMNPEHELVREARLPAVIHQLVVGGGSILPDGGQPLDVVGWFPNETPAIGVVPYGKGRIIMSNPHPNITGQRADYWREKVTTAHAYRWGWTTRMIEGGKAEIQKDKDPDGPEPDLALSRAMLSWAYRKAAQSKDP